MFAKLLAPALLAASVAIPAHAVEAVRAIEVQVDLSAISNPEAAKRYASLDDDLTNAITAAAVGLISDDEDAATLRVDVSEVALQDQFEVSTGIDASSMAGSISVLNSNNNTDYQAFDLTVTLAQAMPYIPQGVDVAVLTPSSDEVYQALVQAFAAEAVARLND